MNNTTMIETNNTIAINTTDLQSIIAQSVATALQAQNKPEPLKGDNITLNDFFFGDFQNTQIENTDTTKNNNINWYKAHIKKHLGDMSLSSITYKHLQDFITYLDVELDRSYSTLWHYRGLLKHIFKYAYEEKYINENPAKKLKISRKKRDEQTNKLPATTEHYYAMYEVAKDDWAFIIIPLLFETGMRKEEILGLEWSDIYDGCIHVKRAYGSINGGRGKCAVKSLKTQKSFRSIPITPTLAKALKRHKAQQGHKTFVVSQLNNDERMKPTFFDNKFKTFKRKACIRENITPHSCRHYFTCKLHEMGISDNEGMRLTGHATLKMYYHYAYVEQSSKSTNDKFRKAMSDESPIEL